ncbi:MAG: prolipoprotein diacylglyceryl transferase [Lachnospiraceae bacterium]|nr:prolipoprotein diacylglyceryl transferase [Lachnospiraceae bacterium]MDD7024822.1 prolipoprotein diacylglyceryl transferase [Oscillospiraceae bacterium]MDY5540454.1 prolipoprotein diacylglyceryl transferase [Lachnospiraceae bacterium]MDY5647373.1 prolipoprotein diacylglyceryl transferase [Lachnospiraceae bacterium]
MDMSINFPHLGIYLEHVGRSISIGGFQIYFYGMIIGFGIIMGVLIAQWQAKRTGQDPETYLDLAMIAVILSIIGARVYYVIFAWDMYKDNLLDIFNIRKGGLAIYGGVLTAIITVYVFARVKKLSFGLLLDTAGLGLVLGQVIGRWGNFFNREAFGGYTDSLLAMQLPVSAVRSSDISADLAAHIMNVGGIDYIQVHPTFLYESLWNLCLLIFLIWYSNRKKFNGEVFLLYLFGYGIGRFWIEGLRTDQLILFGTGLPVSQLLAAVMAVAAAAIILLGRKKAASVSSQETNKAEKSE